MQNQAANGGRKPSCKSMQAHARIIEPVFLEFDENRTKGCGNTACEKYIDDKEP